MCPGAVHILKGDDTMKCPHCGGEVPLESLTCPYCGRPNEAARQHARDMLHYQADYEQTKTEVTRKARRISALTVKIAVIALLLVGILASLIVAGESYSIVWEGQRKEAERRADEYRPVLDEYLEEHQYAEFAAFVQAKGISVYKDSYEEYSEIYYLCSLYRYVELYMMDLVTPDRYASYDRAVKNVTEQIQDFYERLHEGSSWNEEYREAEKTQDAIAGMRENLQALYVAYLGMTPEEAASLETLSRAQQAVAIEEGCENLREAYDEK